MGRWFSDEDSDEVVRNHLGGKHTPDSIKAGARQEYRRRQRERGLTDHEINTLIREHG